MPKFFLPPDWKLWKVTSANFNQSYVILATNKKTGKIGMLSFDGVSPMPLEISEWHETKRYRMIKPKQ